MRRKTVNFERTTSRMEENLTQKPLSKEEILAGFANTTFDPHFVDFFYDRYLDEFEVWEDYDNPDEMALKCVKHGLQWYSLYHQIGHHEQWCKAAYGFGCAGVPIDVSLENEIECMAEVTERVEAHSKDLFIATKDSEFTKHFEHIKKQYKQDGIFMLFYSEYAKEFGFDSDMLETVSREAYSYNYAIERMKSTDFAYFYATWGREGAWRIAELRERLQTEGWDEDYVRTYLNQYANGLEEDGEEREHPDVPAFWEEKVIAYMKAWDYSRTENSGIDPEEQRRFINTYIEVYLHASHPENPNAVPWNRFDDFVMDVAKRRFQGEHVDVEPLNAETLKNAIKLYKE